MGIGRRPAYAKKRVDATAKELTAYARSLGLGVEPLGGAIDAVAWYGPVTRLIDFKTPGKAALTASQGKLLARGCPISFVSTTDQLDLLAHDMKREARA